MFPFTGQEDVRPLSSDDERQLVQLVQKYGLMSLKIALAGLEESCKLCRRLMVGVCGVC